jgi:hypothetical protein
MNVVDFLYSTVQYSTVQYSTMYSTMHFVSVACEKCAYSWTIPNNVGFLGVLLCL